MQAESWEMTEESQEKNDGTYNMRVGKHVRLTVLEKRG